ncbi:MAG: hypothetical protein ACKVZ0_12535 [Gemmatimonadales bacterium]
MPLEESRDEKPHVRITDDFRDNLIIDRYDPLFVGMRASKQKHLRSENSEDAVTWNVFRTLRQIDASVWLPELTALALPGHGPLPTSDVAIYLWANVPPPTSLLQGGDEGVSEIDVLIEAPTWAWCIEAKYHSDISTGTTTRPGRDQVLRNIDVGSFRAGVRDFYFSLLVRSSDRSPRGVETIARYRDLDSVRALLAPHRPDRLANLRAVTSTTWTDLGKVLATAAARATRPGEAAYAHRALEWMTAKGLAASTE